MRPELLKAARTLYNYCQNMVCEHCEISGFCYDGNISSWISQLRWIENNKHKCTHFHDGNCDKFQCLAQHQKCSHPDDETSCPMFERDVV